MLSSQKEENLLQAASQNASLPTFGTFGKVFHSLQGLQQRLDDFSLDDLSKAIDKTKTLSVRLAELQRRLRRLIEIRNFAHETHSVIEKAALEICDLSNLEANNQSSRLAAMAQAHRLIKFPRPPRLASDAIPLDAKIPTQPVIENTNGSAHATQKHPTVAQATENSDMDKEWSLATDLSAFDPGDAWTMESIESTAPAEQPFVQDDPSEPQRTETPETDPTDGPANVAPMPEPMASPENVSTETFAFTLPETEEEAASLAEETPTPLADTPETVEAKALVPAGTDFDQRLLDDLIKDYGEFASSPYVPVPIKPKNETTTPGDDHDRTNSPLTADEGQSATRHLPSIQKEGEIDRKLKKLIKDYGEYDLYSRQSPVNLKTGVIGAFLLLGVIFGAFYFFSRPKAIDSSQPPVITEAAETPAASDASVRNNKTPDHTKTPKGTRGSAAGLP